MNEFAKELERISHGPQGPLGHDASDGMFIDRYFAKCHHNADEVLSTARQVMAAIAKQSDAGWDDDHDWSQHWPQSFIERFAQELSDEEAQAWLSRWRRMSMAQKQQEEAAAWELSNWLYWMDPANRPWRWWDATAVSPDVITVAVLVDQSPYPSGALAWLFKASGAQDFDEEPSGK